MTVQKRTPQETAPKAAKRITKKPQPASPPPGEKRLALQPITVFGPVRPPQWLVEVIRLLHANPGLTNEELEARVEIPRGQLQLHDDVLQDARRSGLSEVKPEPINVVGPVYPSRRLPESR